jgi:hypothetical protein
MKGFAVLRLGAILAGGMGDICRSWRRFVILGICALAFLGGRPVRAQLDQGTITGVVQDSSGAVVANAHVTLANTETGLVLSTSSDKSGIYNFPPVKIGVYTISVNAPGFKMTTQENVRVNVGGRPNVAITLSPGDVSETITVSAAPVQLQTQSAAVEQVVST